MTTSTLHDKLASSGAQMGQFAGSETPVTFGDPKTEFHELLHGTGVYDLSWRGKLILTGSDRVRWLNGMITNNIRDLAGEHGNYNFLLTPQGRIQGDMDAYNRGEYLLISADREQLPKIKEVFDKYIIMDDVDVTDASDKLSSIAISGPTAHEILMRAGIEVPVLEAGQVVDITFGDVGLSLVRGMTVRVQTYEIWAHPDNLAVIWDALIAAGASPVGTQALEWFRIISGIPRFGVDIAERDLPQETAQEQALHYTKGCYVGQEIVERIHSRGNVHRTFVGFELSSGELPQRGGKVQFGAKDVGEITSAAQIPIGTATRNLALGIIRREAAAPGTEVQIGNSTARVAALPFEV